MRPGDLCFIDDAFFEKVNDKNLKLDHETTKRPHIVAFKEEGQDLYWVVPCSTKVDKYLAIVERKKSRGYDTRGILVLDVAELKGKAVFLFQDMFPIAKKYLTSYTRNGSELYVSNDLILDRITKTARYCYRRLLEGFWFSTTPPNVEKIRDMMLREVEKNYR